MSNKNIKLFLIILSVVMILVLAIGYFSGMFDLYSEGIGYLYKNSEKYEYRYEQINESVSFSVDLIDLRSNSGRIIYRNDEAYIAIHEVSLDNEGNYWINFRAYGTYSYDGAMLVSGIKHQKNDDGTFTLNCHSELKMKLGEELYDCRRSGSSGLIHKDGDSFGYYISSKENFEENNINGAAVKKIDFILSGFIKNEWRLKE